MPPSKYLISTWTQEWQSTWSEHNVHAVAFKVKFLVFPSLSWHDPVGVFRDIHDVMHQPQDASVMQARHVVYTEQSELAKGWRNCAVKGYQTRKKVTIKFYTFKAVCSPDPSKCVYCKLPLISPRRGYNWRGLYPRGFITRIKKHFEKRY